MITFFMLFLLFADTNPEHLARAAVDAATVAEKNAETAYASGDLAAVKTELKNMATNLESARDLFIETKKTPGRHPGPYKYAEQRSREILVRLGDLEQRMEAEERDLVAGPKAKIQAIHDDWFEGIMGKK